MKNKVIRNLWLIIINSITLSRLIGALLLPIIFYKYGNSVTALIVLILYLTDAIDGLLARKLHLTTFFGGAMDAMCDKLLNFVAFILLGLMYNIMFCPLVLEITIILINYLIYRHGGNVQTSKTGRLKTIILDIFVILSFVVISLPALKIYIFTNNIVKLLINIFSIIIVVVDFITIIDYDKKYKLVKNDPKITHIKYQNRKRKTIKDIKHDLFDTEYYLKHKNESILKQFYK